MAPLPADSMDIQELVRLIEELLSQRRRELMQGICMSRPWTRMGESEPRSFTYTQLRERVYTNFPRLKRGNLKRPPERTTIIGYQKEANLST